MSSLWFLVCDQRRKKNKFDLFFVVTEAIKRAERKSRKKQTNCETGQGNN